MRAALLLLLAAGPAAAQDTLPAEGSELFRGLLHRLGYTPTLDSAEARVIIFFGPGGGPFMPATMWGNLRNGQSLLIASRQIRDLDQYFPGRPAVHLSGQLVNTWRRQRLDATGTRVVQLQSEENASGLDVPAGVTVRSPHGQMLWASPRHPQVGQLLLRSADGGAFGVAGLGPPGRAAVLADESVLSNQLLAGQVDGEDTGNFEFALNLAKWLKPAGDGPVPCLFLDNNRPVRQFDEVDYEKSRQIETPIPPPPLSAFLTPEAQAKLTDAADQALDRIQENDRLNSPFAGRRYGRAMRWAVGLLALFVAVGLVRRARAALRPRVPPAVAAPAEVGVLAQRQQERLRGGDHTAAVREYLIDLFRSHGLPLDEYRHPTRMPRVVGDAATRDRLRTLWQAAYGPHAVTYTRWKELEPMIEAVRADGAAGRWRFAGGQA